MAQPYKCRPQGRGGTGVARARHTAGAPPKTHSDHDRPPGWSIAADFGEPSAVLYTLVTLLCLPDLRVCLNRTENMDSVLCGELRIALASRRFIKRFVV